MAYGAGPVTGDVAHHPEAALALLGRVGTPLVDRGEEVPKRAVETVAGEQQRLGVVGHRPVQFADSPIERDGEVARLAGGLTWFSAWELIAVENGKRVATPLLMALLLVEATDVVFAVDSIPAIFAVTSDPFIVFTSNIFAILGLRSLFFLLAGVVDKFRYLKTGLAAVLVFVGAKMSLVDLYKVPPLVSLLVIATLLGVAIAASLWVSRKDSLRSASSAKESPRPATG